MLILREEEEEEEEEEYVYCSTQYVLPDFSYSDYSRNKKQEKR
jgi:hypothetical protein